MGIFGGMGIFVDIFGVIFNLGHFGGSYTYWYLCSVMKFTPIHPQLSLNKLVKYIMGFFGGRDGGSASKNFL